MITCLNPSCNARPRRSSMKRVRAMPEVRAPGQAASKIHGIAAPTKGNCEIAAAKRSDGLRNLRAKGSRNRRRLADLADSMARKRAMYWAVRLELSILIPQQFDWQYRPGSIAVYSCLHAERNATLG